MLPVVDLVAATSTLSTTSSTFPQPLINPPIEESTPNDTNSRNSSTGSPSSSKASSANVSPKMMRMLKDPLLQWNTDTTHNANDNGFRTTMMMTIPSTKPSLIQRMILYLRSSSGVILIYVLLFVTMAGGMIYGVSRELLNEEATIDWEVSYNVAFLGNSYFFVNDIPRVLESMSEGRVYQNSCLHPGSSLTELWVTGNGMYKLWNTEEAALPQYETYDFGLCSVAHILQGYDEYARYGNAAGKYYDDGLNPCLHNQIYDTFMQNIQVAKWDYVVLADQTKRMAIPSARNESIQVLQNGYAKFLLSNNKKNQDDDHDNDTPTVVLVDTHAFWSDSTNMTGLSDIVEFTRLIYQGVQAYQSALTQVLRRPPIVAPIGLCFLVIYEEDYDVWKSLFLDDDIHMSMMGSYLFTMVLYTTIFGHLPTSDLYIPGIFSDSRRLVGKMTTAANHMESIVNLDAYFRHVTRRVVLKRYIPRSLSER